MPAGSKVKKGLPKRAGKRSSKSGGNGYSARLHTAQAKRKDARRAEADRRHKRNVALVKAGEMTPWQAAKAARAERRAA